MKTEYCWSHFSGIFCEESHGHTGPHTARWCGFLVTWESLHRDMTEKERAQGQEDDRAVTPHGPGTPVHPCPCLDGRVT